MEETQQNKTHKRKVVGNKATKKDELRKKRIGISDLQPNRGSNLKAFRGTTAGSHKAQKFFRSVEKRETALHVPVVDKTLRCIVAEPPLLVAVVGPPGVGKTTLIRSMVKFYSNRNLQSVCGPITVIAGHSRRLTFIECLCRLDAMCDVAKVADLVLLMVDGSYGFEMETFEFLNIAQVHGLPKVLGIVSHLDHLKTGKALKKRKKFLRHRFWHEVAMGAKLQCLAPMIRGMYRPTDVLNLHRQLICVEPKIQLWRNTHACVVIDRHEDITDPDLVARSPNCSRSIAFYGYTRGKPLKPGQLVHVPGLGDFPLQHLSHQDDPCDCEQAGGGKSKGHRMRHLSMKQKKLYAPYCDVGGIVYDDDAIYVQEDAERELIQRSGEGLQMLQELQRTEPMDAAKTHMGIVRRPVLFRDEDAMELEMEEVRMPSEEEDDDDSTDTGSEDDDRCAAGVQLTDFGLRGEERGSGVGGAEDSSSVLMPRLRDDVDSIRLNQPAHRWCTDAAGDDDDAVSLRALKDLCVTGDWNAGAMRGTEDGEDANALSDADDSSVDMGSKGYDSNDEEFEAVARGDRALLPSRHGDEGGDQCENAVGTAGADHPRRGENSKSAKNALAGVAYASGGTSRPLASGREEGASSPSGWRRPLQDVGGDDFDILAEDAERHYGREADDAGTGDENLDGLVAMFLNKRTGNGHGPVRTVAAPAGPGGDEGIEFYNEKDRWATCRAAGADRKGKDEGEEDSAVLQGATLSAEQERLLQKKMEKKKAFDEEYDVAGHGEGASKSMTYSYYHHLNRQAEEKKEKLSAALAALGDDLTQKIQLVGYFSGLYVRFVLENVPVEFIRLFDPCRLLLAGGVNAGEDEFRIVHARLKRHRWYPKVLKAQDPLLISMGWRRFQTQPIFASEDPSGRHRYLKYTPLHMHCAAAFYAPVAPPNTGFLAIPVQEQRTTNFRISCTGYTIGNDDSSAVVKKLKLTGTPAKIEKTTVFVKGLFTSDIEAAKFVGAKLKSVSGIRGIIKAVLKGKHGLVRATFEDKIFPSDIVFIRTWKPVDPPRYCSMQRNLLDLNWSGMRSMRELRWSYGVPLQPNKDSEYHEIKRRHRVAEEGVDAQTQKVLLSRNMKMQLPYDMKEEFIPLARTNQLRERLRGATTVAPEWRDQRRQALLDTFEDRADAMAQKKDEAKKRARQRALKEATKENEMHVQGLKRAKKETARMREFRSQHKSRH